MKFKELLAENLRQGLDEQNKKFCAGTDCAYHSFATTQNM
jgi:hypothetical protein